ncbi:hybrid sensor histidine kinase/response regulator [Pseudochryseolinea flava]|uniref:histidine kinase n=1 Tax=Pseudochryseolinea flava TaxID=2059302 RepID=A0A364Y6B4_9BACT|nr:hybrid sensor histidine kinase/response regulator [Pseudochryseolinea flava]RAW01775.1 hybrid sensor histidine kinase/response regulator [Pseudochryseolinea flava]
MPTSTQPVRVLVIDDDEDDFFIISDYIKSIALGNFVLEWCYNYQDAVVTLGKRVHDIYFVDYRLGIKTGLDLLRDAMAMKCDAPIILLTGKGNPEVDREAMRIGAMDYLVKSELNTEKLERCIRYSLGRSATMKAMRESERKYRSIFESSKDAVFITDEALRFKDMNAATSEILSYTKEELLTFTLFDLIDGDDLKNRIYTRLVEEGEVVDLEIVVLDNQHEKKICILSASRQVDNDGDVTFQGLIHDITNLKRAEKAAMYAEKLAAAGRLVRMLAHEVRNPLNNIQMSVEHLDSTNIPEDDKVFYDIIKRNVKRIDDIIAELLDSYRPTEKSFKANDLKQVLAQAVQIAQDRITLKGISIEEQYGEKVFIMPVDEEKLKIAFLNILVNATEAIQSTDGRISVLLDEREGDFVVEITDNGGGIPPEILSKLFEPYFTSKRNGMGLGLATTLNIIQSHKGTVDVKSKVNVGTTFTIRFPQTATVDAFSEDD